MFTNLIIWMKWTPSLNLSKFIQEERDNMILPLSMEETEQKAPDGFTGEFSQTFKEEIKLVIYIPENTSRGNISCLVLNQTRISNKQQRHYKKGRLQISISHQHRCKSSPQNISKSNLMETYICSTTKWKLFKYVRLVLYLKFN